MKLTVKMLDAMLTALCELEAGEEPQGVESEEEKLGIMEAAADAQVWIHEELDRRAVLAANRANNSRRRGKGS